MKVVKVNQISDQMTSCLVIFDGFAGGVSRLGGAKFLPENMPCYLVYDYTDEKLDLDLRHFDRIHLLAWSLGVWQAAVSLKKYKLASATALNGTLKPIDDQMGIPKAIFQATLEGWNEVSRKKFNRRIGLPVELAANADCTAEQVELAAIQQRILTTPTPENIYNLVISGEQDKIFALENQQRFWRSVGHEPVVVDAPHYLYNVLESAVKFG